MASVAGTVAGVVAAVPSSVPPTPQEGSLPMKKRESGSPFPLGQVTVEFLFKKLKERAIVHLVQACKKSDTPVYLVCAEHMQGDCFEPEVPFWFTANVSINQGPPVKLQFVQLRKSHTESQNEDGSDFYNGEPHKFFSFLFEEHLTGMMFRCSVEPDDGVAGTAQKKKRKKSGAGSGKAEVLKREEEKKNADDTSPLVATSPLRRKKKPSAKAAEGGGAGKKKNEAITNADGSSAPNSAKKKSGRTRALEAVDELERQVQELIAETRKKIKAIRE